MNCSLLEKVQYLLSNAQLDMSFWAETLEYAIHLMNRLSFTTIRGKTPLDIWSGELLRTMVCCESLDVWPTLVPKITS